MRRLAHLAVLALLASTIVATPLLAQRDRREPKRPDLGAGRDTNDWRAYYLYGIMNLDRKPDDAAAAFYWASRLDPSQAEPYYGRWTALWATDLDRLMRYMFGQRYVVESKWARQTDSLLQSALVRNPFLHRGLERRLWDKIFDEIVRYCMQAAANDVTLNCASIGFTRTGSPYTTGWLAYTRSQFGLAATKFLETLQREPKFTQARLYLARSLYHMGEYDSSANEMGRVLEEMRRDDRKKLIYFYESKAQFEYSIGMIRAARGDVDGAREAYGRALTEDLSFHMAHAQLGAIALAEGDTATALLEYGQASELSPTDPSLRFTYGAALLTARRAAEGEAQLRKAIELEPYHAASHFNLGVALDMQGKLKEAADAYGVFLARAAQTMSAQIQFARERVEMFKTTAGS
ncbi:MAG: tetratricopeptide repeat protein [Gemmatimonadaceae bacterium]